jgi:tetratricopeptide (TPR) repeat protein
VIGRGLLGFQLGSHDRVDADLEAALRIFRELHDDAGTALAHSFYAEVALTRGDVDEARRRRLAAVANYSTWPETPFVLAACAYSRGKLGLLDGDLDRAELAYREAADGFAEIDRPVMRSMSLGVVADFDERAGNYDLAITALEEAVETNDALGLHGFMGSVLARLGWALLQVGNAERAEPIYERALDLARRLDNTPVVFLSLTGLAVLHRSHGRDDEAVGAATEALDLYLLGAPRRLANRVDPLKDSLAAAAVCCAVLGSVASGTARGQEAGRLLGQADALRRSAGAPVPQFRLGDRERSIAAIVAALGQDGFDAAFELGRGGQLGRDVAFRL